MLNTTWKAFIQTGNIETYLLLKEIENVGQTVEEQALKIENNNNRNIEEIFQK